MSKYKLYGFTSPTCTSPSFLTPVFKKEDALYVQDIDKNDLIKGFEKVKIDELHSIQGNSNEEYDKGQDALFGVSDSFYEVSYNTRNQLKPYLRSKIYDYIDKPFFYKEVSDFCESVLPEFYGCETNRDFLIRQVISNLIPEFVEKNQVRIETVKQRTISSSSSRQLSELFCNKLEKKVKLKSNHDSLLSTYEHFFNFATEKHKKLSENSSFRKSLDIVGNVLSSFDENELGEFTNLRSNLIYILDCKIESKGSNNDHYKPKKSKAMRKHYSKELIKTSILDDITVTTDGLSFILYITSRFKQEAKKNKT